MKHFTIRGRNTAIIGVVAIALIIIGLSVATYPYSSMWFENLGSSEYGIAVVVLIVLAIIIPLLFVFSRGMSEGVREYKPRYRNLPSAPARRPTPRITRSGPRKPATGNTADGVPVYAQDSPFSPPFDNLF